MDPTGLISCEEKCHATFIACSVGATARYYGCLWFCAEFMCKTPQLCAICMGGCSAALPVDLAMCAYRYKECIEKCDEDQCKR